LTTVSKNLIVPYSAGEMFNLVDNVETYPDFLPWCKSTVILNRHDDQVRARIELARGGLHKSFTTWNLRHPGKMLEIRLVEGPFHHLHGFWRFDNLTDQACKVSLDLDFEFSGRVLGLAFGPVFNQIANTLVDAFYQRAIAVYGKR
jgi:ribosome-associated toxin RatA of RatAB toxin-antitoxin module